MPRRMPTTLRPRFRAQARGGSLLHHAPNRRPRFPRSTPPPGPSAHPSGFSVRSQQDSFGFNPTAHQRLPFVPPLPRSSIPGSAAMIPQTCPRRLSEIHLSEIHGTAANLAIFSANFAPINLIIYASALLLFRWLFLINAFGQNFANQPTAPRGRGNFSFQSNCASPSPIAHDGDSMTILKKAKSISFDE